MSEKGAALCVKLKGPEDKLPFIQEMVANLARRDGCEKVEEAVMKYANIAGPKALNLLDYEKFEEDFRNADPVSGYDCRSFFQNNIKKLENKEEFELLCSVCPFCDAGKANYNQLVMESSFIAYICHLPYEQGIRYLGHPEIFKSCDDLNSESNATLKEVCIHPFASMIIELLGEKEYALYREITKAMADENAYKKVVDKIAQELCKRCGSEPASGEELYRPYVGQYFYEAYFNPVLIKRDTECMIETYFSSMVEQTDAPDQLEDDFESFLMGMDEVSVQGGEVAEEERELPSSQDEASAEQKQESAVEMAEMRRDVLSGFLDQNAYYSFCSLIDYRKYIVLYLDINNLKYMNDNFGHSFGDQMIRDICGEIRNIFYTKDNIFRVGGDEFVAFLDVSTGMELVEEMVGKLQEAVSSYQKEAPYSIAVGAASGEEVTSLEQLTHKADRRMYADKARQKKEHPELDMRREYGRDELSAGPKPDSQTETVTEGEPLERDLCNHPFFTKKVKTGEGGWLSKKEPIEVIAASDRKYLIPFAVNDTQEKESARNVIIHHEITESMMEGMMDISTGGGPVEMEIHFLVEKVKKDKKMPLEMVYVTDRERYILLIWNAGTSRYNYIPVIDRKEGKIKTIPIQIIRLLKSENIKKICFQPFLLCGILSLYERELEMKNVHSIYSHYQILSQKKEKETGLDIFDVYTHYASDKFAKQVWIAEKRFRERCRLLAVMPLYCNVMSKQYDEAELCGKIGLCANQDKKDLMYGYSYLAAGIYPSMQGARFILKKTGEISFPEKVTPCVSYEPGYIVEFTFANIESEEGEEIVRQNVRENRRARQLLLAELSKKMTAFYHSRLKILYFDNYKIVFFMTHDYKDENQKLIEQSLYRECTRNRISSNKLKAVYWATTFNTVRVVSLH